jgi:RNA-directed DNA polymerase
MRGLLSVKGLGWKLGIRSSALEKLGASAVRHYHPFPQPRPGKKSRWIANPDKELKFAQRQIDRRLLRTLPLPDHLHGGVKGRSPRTNASAHLRKHTVVRLDLEDFFPSVTDGHVYALWEKLGYGPPVAALLTSLTTYRGRLPQGAPTSMALANLILLDADKEMQSDASNLDCSFTRYVDDVGFSGDRPEALIEGTIRILRKAGFRVSRDKIDIMPNSGPQKITGLNLNSGRPSVPRKKRDEIRAAIHQLRAISGESSFRKAVASIQGRIQYVAVTNPGSADALKRKLANVLRHRGG